MRVASRKREGQLHAALDVQQRPFVYKRISLRRSSFIVAAASLDPRYQVALRLHPLADGRGSAPHGVGHGAQRLTGLNLRHSFEALMVGEVAAHALPAKG